VAKALSLNDGSRIVLDDVLGRPLSRDKASRNIYRVSADGQVVWRVSGPSPLGQQDEPYTSIYFDEGGKLKGYNWNGGEYGIDVDTGKADGGKLVK